MTLDLFTRAYIEAMFFADTPEGEHWQVSDLSAEAWQRIAADCAAFQASDAFRAQWFDAEHAGHDFWLTRQGHGAGFWDGGWPAAHATALTAAAKSFGECWPYRGDDGRLYF